MRIESEHDTNEEDQSQWHSWHVARRLGNVSVHDSCYLATLSVRLAHVVSPNFNSNIVSFNKAQLIKAS
ncbi:BTB/POZ domain-containing protein [Trichinella pseudospiralis]